MKQKQRGVLRVCWPISLWVCGCVYLLFCWCVCWLSSFDRKELRFLGGSLLQSHAVVDIILTAAFHHAKTQLKILGLLAEQELQDFAFSALINQVGLCDLWESAADSV